MARSETAIQKDIIDALRAVYPGGVWIRVQSGRVKVRGGWMQLAPKGTPDLHGDLPVRGRKTRVSGDGCFVAYSHPMRMLPIAIEVKRPGEAPTAEQDAKLVRYRACNAIGIVAHSVEEALVQMRDELERLGLEAV